MMWLLALGRLIPSPLKRFAGWAGAMAVVLLAGIGMVKKNQRLKDELDDAHEHIDTRKRIDDAVDTSRRDGGAWHDRLRKDRDKR